MKNKIKRLLNLKKGYFRNSRNLHLAQPSLTISRQICKRLLIFVPVWQCRRSLHLLYLSLRWEPKVVSSVVQDPAETVRIRVPVVRPAETIAVFPAVLKAVVGLGEVGAATETGPIISHAVTCPRLGTNLFRLIQNINAVLSLTAVEFRSKLFI
jgi:hypothetical protein